MFRSGFIALIGEPNVGKSTFLNAVLKQKVAIVSKKPQTTRNVFSGIYNDDDAQLIFMDTPGIHKPEDKLGAYMSNAALSTVKTVDLVLFFINAYDDVKPWTKQILKKMTGIKTPVFLVVNKLDTITDFERLGRTIDAYKAFYDFEAAFGVSALKGTHVDMLVEDIKEKMPEGPKYYRDGEISDRPEQFLIAEFIREKVLEHTHQEVPYSVACRVESLAYKPKVVDIHATVVVERPSQKGIVIGKGGRMLKKIGMDARTDIEELLGQKVYLELFCRVEEDWRNKPGRLRDLGYRRGE